MRVALVTSLEHGGPLEHALVLARGLAGAGVDVQAVSATVQAAERFEQAGAQADVIPLRHQLDGLNARRVAAAVAGADVVHAHDRRSGLWTRLLPWRRDAAARVYSVHGLPEPYLPPPAGPARPGLRATLLYRGLDGGLAARADAIVTPSQAVARVLAERIGFPADRIRVIPNGVEPADETAGDGELVGTLSVLEPVKDLATFLEAAALVARERPGQRFVVFGTGSQGRALRARAATLGLGASVTFAGFVARERALRQLRVLALPSLMENAPMAMLEAMAAGVPVVASRVGGIPELAPPGTAELVAPGDPRAFAGAILRLLADPAGATAMAARARAHVTAHLGVDAMVERMLALYRELAR